MHLDHVPAKLGIAVGGNGHADFAGSVDLSTACCDSHGGLKLVKIHRLANLWRIDQANRYFSGFVSAQEY